MNMTAAQPTQPFPKLDEKVAPAFKVKGTKLTSAQLDVYRGCPIYIQRWGFAWQYLFVYKNELYQAHLGVKPVWWRRYLPYPNQYSVQEAKGIAVRLAQMAQATIDTLHEYEKTPKA